MVQSGQAPGQWKAFTEAVRQELIPMESVYQSRDRLRSLSQKASVSSYINEVRNNAIGIPGIREGEKLETF